MNITHEGKDLRIDFGAMEELAALTGKSPMNPLEGVDAIIAYRYIYAVGRRTFQMMYGGDVPTLEQGYDEFKRLPVKDLLKLERFYKAATTVDDGKADANNTEKKS